MNNVIGTMVKTNKRSHRRLSKNKTRRVADDFAPNLTPKQIFELGSFGGTYWRPIYSSVVNKHLHDVHLKYPFLKSIPENLLTSPIYDKHLNKYDVEVGTSLEFWESKGWIHKQNPYGWVHWYCDYYLGKRSPDDFRQIQRWKNIAGKNGRFRRNLIRQIRRKHGKWNDYSISPKIRQTLQHWGYRLTERDFLKGNP